MGVAQMSTCKDYTPKAAAHLGSPCLSANAICRFAEAQRLGEVSPYRIDERSATLISTNVAIRRNYR
jgi:hypothetical protein